MVEQLLNRNIEPGFKCQRANLNTSFEADTRRSIVEEGRAIRQEISRIKNRPENVGAVLTEETERLVHDYDAIVSDIKMPGMDGLSLLSKIQDLRPETPTLLITGHGEHDLAVRALRGGAYDFIQKPPDLNRLLITIRNAMERNSLVNEARSLKRKALKVNLLN